MPQVMHSRCTRRTGRRTEREVNPGTSRRGPLRVRQTHAACEQDDNLAFELHYCAARPSQSLVSHLRRRS